MAYESTQPVVYPLGQGLDADKNAHLSDAPSLVSNGVFRRLGVLEKRPGTEDRYATDKKAFVFVDDALFGVEPGLSVLGSAERDVDLAPMPRETWDCVAEALVGVGTGERFVAVDLLQTADLVCVAWAKVSSAGLLVFLRSGTIQVDSLALSGSAMCARVFWDGTQARVVYLDTGSAKTRTISSSGVISAESTIAGGFSDIKHFDACAFPYNGSTRFAVVGQDSGGTNLRVSDSAGGSATIAVTTAVACCSIAPWSGRDGVCAVAAIDGNATPVLTSEWSTAGATLSAASRDSAGPSISDPYPHAIGVVAVNATQVDVWHGWAQDVNAGDATHQQRRYVRRYRKTTGVSVGPSDRIEVSNTAMLASRPYAAAGNSRAWLALGVQSGNFIDQGLVLCSQLPAEGSVAVHQAAALPQQAYSYQEFGGLRRGPGRLPDVIDLGGGEACFGALREDGSALGLGLNAQTSSICRVTVSAATPSVTRLRGGALVSGSLPRRFVGSDLTASGFRFSASIVSATASASGTALQNGLTYSYHAAFCRVGADGAVEYGPFSLNVQLAGDGHDATLVLRCHPQDFGLSDARVALFRTVEDSETFKLVGMFSMGTSDVVTVTDSISDTDLNLQAISPLTSRAGLSDVVWPPHRVCALARNRYWIVPRDYEYDQIWFSRKLDAGAAAGFDGRLVRVPFQGGRITGLVEFFDKLLVLKESAIYLVDGDGPGDKEGDGTDFGKPFLVHMGTGCINTASIVQVDSSVLFLDSSGIVSFGQDLKIEKVGSPVRRYTGAYKISGASLAHPLDEVVFTTNGPALCYNTRYGAWSIWTNHEARACCHDDQGLLQFISAAGRLKRHTSGWLDGATWVPLTIVTPWMPLGKVGAYGRAKAWQILGWANSDAALSVLQGFDFDPEYLPALSFQQQGRLLPFGPGELLDGQDLGDSYERQALLVRFDQGRTRASAVRFLISDAEVSGHQGSGQGVSLSALVLEVEPSVGVNRSDTARSA